MQHQKKCNFTCHTYSDHLKEMMKEMMTSGEFADVTLVCDDKRKINAHKNILAACSPVLKDILKIENSSVIYLKGINFFEMESILQFMYLGEATFYKAKLNEFLDVAKSLEIREFDKDKTSFSEEEKYIEEDNTVDEKQTEALPIPSIPIEKPGVNHPIKVSLAKLPENEFHCNLCDKIFRGPSGLYRHNKNVHEGDSNQCDNKTTHKNNLKRPIQLKHAGAQLLKLHTTPRSQMFASERH